MPRQVRLISGESTGSFIGRLAALNGISPGELLGLVGDGTKAQPPQFTEVYLNAMALERLAVMTGRGREVLQRALPNLRDHHLLDESSGPVWRWPQWEAKGVFLVRACDLCAAAKRMASDVYVVSVTRWRVCARHGRWLDNLREAGVSWLPLREVPEVVEAHRQRVLLERRLGGGGRALFADALHIASFWWNIPALSPPVWFERRDRFRGPVGSDLRVAPLVCYPEVVHLAYVLAARERRRMRGTWSTETDKAWLRRVGDLLEEWQMPAALALVAVDIWRQRHSTPPPGTGATRPSQGRSRRLPVPLPHQDAPADTHLEHLACVPWRFGDEPPALDDTQVWSVAGQA
ncbi:TniQ family protein [Streptomyces botrytidirepellens]|uniref:TniQ family protein n=1 Tax=Streptomyces botrytidirepellens TaxID=2486417 RepID=UPI0016116F30|nr:TniQ family protein [Streptomyces botrytidirepellens]